MDQVSVERRFAYKGVMVIALVGCIFNFLGIYFGIGLISEGSIAIGIALMTSIFFIFGVVVSNIILMRSNILIAADGISRSLLGFTLQKLRWDEIDRIDVLKRNNGNISRPRVVRIFNIYKKGAAPASFPLKLGRMMFDEQLQEIDELVKLLNKYAAKYKIPLAQDDEHYVRRPVSSL